MATAAPTAPPAAPPRRRAATWKGKLALALGTCLALFVVLEVGFRTYDVFFPKKTKLCNPFLLFRGGQLDWHTWLKTPDQVIQPNGREVIRIVCVGGSTTQDATAYTEERITYPTALQAALNDHLGNDSGVVVETINAGFASHSTLHNLILLETEVVQLKPDLVICYENINDILVNYFPGPTAPAYANKFLHPFYLPPEFGADQTCLLDNSRFLSWARRGLRRLFWYQVRYTDQPIELAHADQYRDNWRHFAAIAKVHGIKVAFGQQAMAADQELFERHFKTKSYNPVVEYPRIDQFRQHFERYNAIVRAVAAEQQIPCADPYTLLKDRPELFADVVHLHADGAKLVGREFARCLIASGLLQELVDAKRKARGLTQAPAVSRPDPGGENR